MNFYKTDSLSNISDFTDIHKLCVYNNMYYFYTKQEFSEFEMVTEDEFNNAINSVYFIKSDIETNNTENKQVTNNVLNEKLDTVEENQLTTMMALADIYEAVMPVE